jgi:hypothetical protein
LVGDGGWFGRNGGTHRGGATVDSFHVNSFKETANALLGSLYFQLVLNMRATQILFDIKRLLRRRRGRW